MQLLGDAWKIVLENKQLVATYVALVTTLGFLKGVIDVGVGNVLGSDATTLLNLIDIISRIAVSAGYAAVYAVIFSRLGKEIDKPLWKCTDDQEAVKRFFMPWFILILTFMLLARFRIVAASQQLDDVMLTLELIIMLLFVFIIPLGACIMYWGKLELDDIPEALSPIARQFPLVALVLILGLGQFFIGVVLYPNILPEFLQKNPAAYIPMDIALGIVDCLAFSTMWLILMVHRDTDYGHDVDF